MPKLKAAFFDVDNTLLNVKSMFSFQQFYYQQQGGDDSYSAFVDRLQAHPQKHDRLVLNRYFYESFAGRRQSMLATLADNWFNALLSSGPGLWIASARELAEQLREDGYRLVAVSGSTHEILAPLLRHLRFDDCLATTLDVQDDICSGRIAGIQMIGEGKAVAMRGYAADHGIALADCAACGDHITDAPMLEQAGKAWVVAGDPQLEQLALERGWPVLAAELSDSAQLAHV